MTPQKIKLMTHFANVVQPAVSAATMVLGTISGATTPKAGYEIGRDVSLQLRTKIGI